MEYKLSDIFDLQMGKTPSRHNLDYWKNGTLPWISISDLSKCDKLIIETSEHITDIAESESGIKLIPANTVVMSFKLSIGKLAITSKPMYSNEAIMAFIDKGIIDINPTYLFYLLSQKDWDRETNKAVMGKTLNKATLSQIKINIHSLREQEEMAKVLEMVRKLIDSRKYQIEEFDNLVKSRFIEMFGSIRNNSHDYKVGNLEDYIIFLTSGSRGWSKYFSNHGEIFITIKNVKNTLVSQENIQYVIPPENQEAKRTKVQEGDLLISITADLGRTGVVPKDIAVQGAYINQHLSLVRLDRSFLNPRYVAFFLETDEGKEQFQRQNKSSVKAGLNFNDIKHLKILIPPKSAQDEFVNYVEVIDKSKLAEPQDKYFWWEILTLL